MKTARWVIFSLIALSGILYSCHKNKKTADPPTIPPAEMKWNNTAGELTATSISARLTTRGGLTIDGITQDSIKIHLAIVFFNGVDVYNCGYGTTDTITYTVPKPYFNYYYTSASPAGTGTIKITSYDQSNNTISGNFTFGAAEANNPANVVVLTGGTFSNVRLSSISYPPSGSIKMGFGGNYKTTSNYTAVQVGNEIAIKPYYPQDAALIYIFNSNDPSALSGLVEYSHDSTYYPDVFKNNLEMDASLSSGNLVTGHFKETEEADFEGSFKDIHYNKLPAPPDGQLVFHNSSGNDITFDTGVHVHYRQCFNSYSVVGRSSTSLAACNFSLFMGSNFTIGKPYSRSFEYYPDSTNESTSTLVSISGYFTITKVDSTNNQCSFIFSSNKDISTAEASNVNLVDDRALFQQQVTWSSNGTNYTGPGSTQIYVQCPNNGIHFEITRCEDLYAAYIDLPCNIAPGTYYSVGNYNQLPEVTATPQGTVNYLNIVSHNEQTRQIEGYVQAQYSEDNPQHTDLIHFNFKY